jgi:DNA-binding MarR family transcriptional regulator
MVKRIREQKTAGEYARILGYSNMTMTRAFDELEEARLIEVTKSGKERFLHQNRNWKELWEMSVPYLRSPVKNEIYIMKATEDLYHSCFKAELTALSEYTMISTPRLNVFAIGTEKYKNLCENKKIKMTEYPEDAIAKLQEWKYSPELIGDEGKETVDRFSLYLSLQNNEDERIQSALEELIRSNEW